MTARAAGIKAGRKLRQFGVYITELAIILPLFLLLLIGVLDFSRLMYTQITLEHAIREGGRFGVTGNRLPGEEPGDLLNRIDSIKRVIEDYAVGVNVNTADIEISTVDGGDGDAGGGGELFTISLTHSVDLVTPLIAEFFDDGKYTFTVETSFRNEPFDD